jgi:8-oxo-dGTP pyrophosphatase MutT (NUDIX family)
METSLSAGELELLGIEGLLIVDSLTTDLDFNNSLRLHVSTRLEEFDVRCIQPTGRKRAAVAVTLVSRLVDAGIGSIPFVPSQSNHAALILTIRASSLRAHAGQRAFPGGRIDPGESPEQAALRELQEEVGLALEPDAILGRLDDYETRSGYVMTPVVLWGGRAPLLKPALTRSNPFTESLSANFCARMRRYSKDLPAANTRC